MDRIKGLKDYVKRKEYRDALGLPAEQVETYELLAYGEYNMNYLFTHPISGELLILRVECGSQMHLADQIEYEAKALSLLVKSACTPIPRYSDGSKNYLEHGVLVETFLPGNHLDYYDDEELRAVAKSLADIHSIELPVNHSLISVDNTLKAIVEESESMFAHYNDSELADPEAKTRISNLIKRGKEMIAHCTDDSKYRCCINTELNNTNFLLDKNANGEFKAYVIDWEKPLYGDPAQDLGHFLTPTTTFWKTDVIWNQTKMDWFIDEYIKAVDGRFDTEGLRERVHLIAIITCLRGISWCSMAYVQYQEGGKKLMDEYTRSKLNSYLSDPLLSAVEGLF